MSLNDHGSCRTELGGLFGEETDAVAGIDQAEILGRIVIVLRRGRGHGASSSRSWGPAAAGAGLGSPPTPLATTCRPQGLKFGSGLGIEALARPKVIELHVGDGVVDAGYVGRVATRTLDSVARRQMDAVDAADAHLPDDEAVLPTGCRGGNVGGRGGEDLDVAPDEAVDGIQNLLVFGRGEKEGVVVVVGGGGGGGGIVVVVGGKRWRSNLPWEGGNLGSNGHTCLKRDDIVS